MIFLVYLDDYAEPMPMVGPFESEDAAMVAYITAFREDNPGEGDSRPGETLADTGYRIYLTDDSVRLGKA